MLRLHPDKRARASELVHHSWLDGVLVAGEVQLIRQAEEAELRRRQAEARAQVQSTAAAAEGELGGGGMIQPSLSAHGVSAESRARLVKAEERHWVEEASDADALKPVGDVMNDEPTTPSPSTGGTATLGPGAPSSGMTTAKAGANASGSSGATEKAEKGHQKDTTVTNTNGSGKGHRHAGSKTSVNVRIDTKLGNKK